jgi:hypothetical protein
MSTPKKQVEGGLIEVNIAQLCEAASAELAKLKRPCFICDNIEESELYICEDHEKIVKLLEARRVNSAKRKLVFDVCDIKPTQEEENRKVSK